MTLIEEIMLRIINLERGAEDVKNRIACIEISNAMQMEFLKKVCKNLEEIINGGIK